MRLKYWHFRVQGLTNDRYMVDYSSRFESVVQLFGLLAFLATLVFAVLVFFKPWAGDAAVISIGAMLTALLLHYMFGEYYEFDNLEQTVKRRVKRFFISRLDHICTYSQIQGLALFPVNPEEEDDSLVEWAMHVVLRSNEFFMVGETLLNPKLAEVEEESRDIASRLGLPYYRLISGVKPKDALLPVFDFSKFQQVDKDQANLEPIDQGQEPLAAQVLAEDANEKTEVAVGKAEPVVKERDNPVKFERDFEKNRIIVDYTSVLEGFVSAIILLIFFLFLPGNTILYFVNDAETLAQKEEEAIRLQLIFMMIGFVVFIALIQKYYEDEVHFDLANQQFKIITRIMNVSFSRKTIPFAKIKGLVVNGYLSRRRYGDYWHYELDLMYKKKFYAIGNTVSMADRDLLIEKSEELAKAVQLSYFKIDKERRVKPTEDSADLQFYTLDEVKYLSQRYIYWVLAALPLLMILSLILDS